MTTAPIICFGQQPCGFFPKRYLYSKIYTAKRLQSEIGGEIVFFCHDSDHDYRETRTTLRHPMLGASTDFNFEFENKIQKKYSPLYLKRVSRSWQAQTAQILQEYVDFGLAQVFQNVVAATVSDFCLEMYRALGLLDGIRVARSSDPEFRRSACQITDFFVDVPYENEIVRARCTDGTLKLHKGGDAFITLPPMEFSSANISPARDTRLRWMQSVIRCTHYVAGASEIQYLHTEDAPEITYIERDPIECADEAYVEFDPKSASLLVFGAHPDDIEFACGAVIAKANRSGQFAHFVVCSQGEAGTYGTPQERIKEAQRGAEILRASIEFMQLDGDAHLEARSEHAVALARIIRRIQPNYVLAPSLAENQHPDHARLGAIVRDATRLARYGGLEELRELRPHAIQLLISYAVSPDAEPRDITPVFIDVSAPDVIADWTAAMEAHASQTQALKYVELQLTRARLNGLRAGVEHAVALFPNDPLIFDSLTALGRGAKRF